MRCRTARRCGSCVSAHAADSPWRPVRLVFALLAATFVIVGIEKSSGTSGIVGPGGRVGLATAVAAWYASFAAVTNATFARTVLPVAPLRR
ncbi:MAG TPA: GPR1/FUN34/YaaH family transporter [Solirubrobacteraceae bacterium]|nr:GPR1/FUN34/YaaH family transporter [Solirubrobacteraceae bacterium]